MWYHGKLDGDRVEGSVHKADIQPGSPLLLTLGPIEPVVILGKVVDADTGEPVQSLELIEGNRVGLGGVDFTHGQHVKKTSADGKFRHEMAGFRSLRVHAPGYYPADTRVYRSGVLRGGLDWLGALSGRVLDADALTGTGAEDDTERAG